MFRKMVFTAAVVLGCAGFVRAAGLDDVTAAFQKLADSPNYSWKSTVDGGQGSSETDGKTQKDGLTTLTITRQDTTYQAVIEGDKIAVKTDAGWQSEADLADAAANGGPERFLVRMLRNFKSPIAMAQSAVGDLQNLQQTDNVYTADLSDAAATKALTFRMPANANMDPPTVSNAKVSVKVTLDGGNVSKLEVHATGTITFNGNDRDIDRTTTTTFSDVGTTTIEVPDEAKAKLDASAPTPPAAPPTTQQ